MGGRKLFSLFQLVPADAHSVLCFKEVSHCQKDCLLQAVELKYFSIYFFFWCVINLCCDTDGNGSFSFSFFCLFFWQRFVPKPQKKFTWLHGSLLMGLAMSPKHLNVNLYKEKEEKKCPHNEDDVCLIMFAFVSHTTQQIIKKLFI